MITLVAIALFGFAALRLVDRVGARPRLAIAFLSTVALTCASYGALDASAPRARETIPLRFQDAAGDLAVWVDQVPSPRATPRNLLACAAVAFAASILLGRRRRARRARVLPPVPIVAFALLLALPYALTFASALWSTARGYDALWYHLPTAVAFARDRHLEPPGRDLVFYFPADVELWARALLDGFGPRALSLVQWPFALASAAAAHALARRVGARRGAPLACALVLAAPMVIFQSALAYTDVAALAAVAAAAVLLLSATRAPIGSAIGRAALGGLALGLLAGSKYAALPLLAALAPVAALYALAPDGKPRLRNAGRAALLLAVVALACALPSWFWFARNLRLTGNPIFPIAVPSLHLRGLFRSADFNPGKELEFVSRRALWALYPWIERASHESGLGGGFAVVGPLGAVVLAGAFLRRAIRGRLPAFGLPLLWGILYAASWWIGTPHEPRHLLPLVVLVGAPALLLLEPRRARRPLALAVALGLAFSTLTSLRALLFSATPELSARPRTYAALYELPPALTRLVPDGARVANRAGRPYNFALLGPRLSWRLFDYAPNPPSAADLAWNRIDYLLYRGPEGGLPHDPALHLLYEAAARDLTFWEARPGDVVALYRIR